MISTPYRRQDRDLRFRVVAGAAVGLLLLLLGTVWIFARPPMFEADSNFHLTSIACSNQSAGYCTVKDEATAIVPLTIADRPCYFLDGWRGADCFRWHPESTETTYWDSGGDHLIPGYHWILSRFLGPDLWSSLVAMQVFNIAIASILLAMVVILCPRNVRNAAVAAWLVLLVPVGIFSIGSINPAGWAITGIGTFWAFLLGLTSSTPLSTGRRLGLWSGLVFSALIAVLGRVDSVIYIAVIFVAVALLRWHRMRRIVWPVAAIIAISAVLASLATDRVNRAWTTIMASEGNPAFEVSPLTPLIHIVEWPLLLAYMVGMPTPFYLPYPVGYTSGLGFDKFVAWRGLEFPSIVGLCALGAVVIVVTIGLTRYSRRKIAAAGLLIGALIVMSFGWSWATEFVGTAVARYYVGPALAIVGVLALQGIPRPWFPRRIHAIAVWILTSTAGTAALMTLVRRSTSGQELAENLSWINPDAYVMWWWPNLVEWPIPNPNTFILIGCVVTLLYTGLLVWILRRTTRSYAPVAPQEQDA